MIRIKNDTTRKRQAQGEIDVQIALITNFILALESLGVEV